MPYTKNVCDELVSEMFDLELYLFLSRINDGAKLTPLQEAVLAETQRRQLHVHPPSPHSANH